MAPPVEKSFPLSGDQDIGPYRIMIVDDSAVIRGAIARTIETDSAFKITASISNGENAVKTLKCTPVDVIILDIEMPGMDGLTAIPLLKNIDPAVQIIMASTLTQRNAEITLRAMSLGATDYIPKPSSMRETTDANNFKREIVEKSKVLGELARRSGVRPDYGLAHLNPIQAKPIPSIKKPTEGESPAKSVIAPRQTLTAMNHEEINTTAESPLFINRNGPVVIKKEILPVKPNIIAIGSSTGGPQALFTVIKDLGDKLPQPIVITQHMPPSFTTILAEHITKQCGVECTEGHDGEELKPGHYYVAPGDFHMVLERRSTQVIIKLTKAQPENFCRPSVDPMLRSLIPLYGKNILTIILTGMGQDGAKGGIEVVNAGGSVIAQDETTSVVWGMPGAVAMAGICSAILPVTEIGGYARRIAVRAPQ